MYDQEATTTDLSNLELPGVPYAAEILTTADSLDDDIFVTIPQMDSDDDPRGVHEHGPCHGWDARSDGAMPTKGDPALVFLDDAGEYWISAWEPAA